MPRSSETRRSPTDLDEPDEKQKPAPSIKNMQFDYHYRGGSNCWPERHKYSKIKFGPGLIKKAWQVGLVVIAYIEGFPYPVAVTESRWNTAKCFEVRSQGIWYLPLRLRTLTSTSGLMSTGEWIDPDLPQVNK